MVRFIAVLPRAAGDGKAIRGEWRRAPKESSDIIYVLPFEYDAHVVQGSMMDSTAEVVDDDQSGSGRSRSR